MRGLVIDTTKLARIIEAPTRVSSVTMRGEGGEALRVSVVSEEVIAETRERYPACRCEELGLYAGMNIGELIRLEEGCTGTRQRAQLMGLGVPTAGNGGGWVCERLDKVRRTYRL